MLSTESPWCRVSLRILSYTIDADTISRGLDLIPSSTRRVPRSIGSSVEYLGECITWLWELQIDSQTPPDLQIKQLIAVLRLRAEALRGILTTRGTEGELFV